MQVFRFRRDVDIILWCVSVRYLLHRGDTTHVLFAIPFRPSSDKMTLINFV